ncbi:MAG: site-specific integrase [Rickettsiales bacterium]|nr:site-specific integrase [Rickettsiales bacterium]
MKKLNFTKSELNNIVIPKNGREYYQDLKEKGLSLYVTSNGIKTFYIRKRINGKDEKVIIGNYPDMSIENARKHINMIKGKIAEGINPNQEKSKLKSDLLFKDMFNKYIEEHSKVFKKTWKEDINQYNRYLKSIANNKLGLITNDIVKSLCNKVAKENGVYASNRLLALIRIVFNKAIDWGWEGKNPVYGIKKFKEQSRDRFIQADELPRFFKALDEEENETAKDYIYISLYTGARKNNVLSMKWEDINFTTNQWRIPNTKNGEPLTVPLIKEAVKILKTIKQTQEDQENKGNQEYQNNLEHKKNIKEDAKSLWVFPSPTSQSGHLEDPKKAWERILKRANIKNLRIHDIRRTLGSYQAIGGSSLLIIGKSLGHKSHQATQIYSRMNLDPVRESMKNAIELINSYKNKNELQVKNESKD